MSFERAQSLQVVWFFLGQQTPQVAAIYRLLAGQDAASIQINRQLQAGNPFLAVATGGDDGVSLRLTVQPSRLDYHITPQGAAPESPGIGMLRDTATHIKQLFDGAELVSREDRIHDVIRLAFVAKFADACASIDEANAKVNALIGEVAGPSPGVGDLLLQMNRRKKSAVDTRIMYNRLLRWAAENVQELTLSVMAGQGTSAQIVREHYLATYQVDLNTVPLSISIAPEVQVELLREMQLEAKTLIQNPTPKALQ